MAQARGFVRSNHSRRVVVAAGAVAVTAAAILAAVVVSAAPASASTVNPTPAAGARRNATQLSFVISGTASLSVDVASGNALFTDRLFTLPGIGQDLPVSLFYNSSVFGSTVHSAVTGSPGSGWGLSGFDQHLVGNSDGSVTYFGPGGLSGVFTPDGSGGFVSPPQFQATLATLVGGGWTLTGHVSQTVLRFDGGGLLVSSTDRNGNVTSYAYGANGYDDVPVSVTSTRGPVAGRTLGVHTGGVSITSLSQSSGSLSRSVSFGYSASGHLASVTDSVGGVTSFASAPGTDTGRLVSITNPQGHATTLSFDSSGRVTQVAQENPDGAGTSVTRLAYPSPTQTLMADPDTDQSQPVADVPHTTYDLTGDGSQLVASATDPDGNTRSATYTSVDLVASATPAAGGATTFTYGANGGESLTGVATPGGAGDSVAYGNTGTAQYLPSSATNDAGNALHFTYDGQGNQLTTGQGASGPPATVTYNSDGTVATSAAPGSPAGVVTSYGYNNDHDLTSVTGPSGSGLGARQYTWDGFGRLASASNGRGDTTTYSYDAADRITLVHDSNGDTLPVRVS